MNLAVSRRYDLGWRLATLLLLVAGPSLAHAGNYSCGNPSSSHCYGVTEWQEQPVYYGS